MKASSSTGLPKRQRARACNGQVVIIAAHSDPFPARSTASTVWFRSHSQTRSVACGLTVRIIKAPLACSQPRPVTAWALGRLFRFATPRHHVGGKVWPTNVSVRTTTPKKRTWVFKLSVRTLILLSFVWSENNNKTTTSNGACSCATLTLDIIKASGPTPGVALSSSSMIAGLAKWGGFGAPPPQWGFGTVFVVKTPVGLWHGVVYIAI